MASKNTTLHTTVRTVKRANSSVNGNPAYYLHTDDGTFRTMSDAGWAYGLENDFTVNGEHDIDVTLTLSPAGRVHGYTISRKADFEEVTRNADGTVNRVLYFE